MLIFVAQTSYSSSDAYVLANADPEMMSLADKAYMSDEAKIIFLRANPERIDDAQIEVECGQDTTNSSSALEGGCYDPSTNKIFLRDLPERFDDYEPVIAAHEMLHAAYYATEPDEGVQKELQTMRKSIKDKLALYDNNDEQTIIDETHSFVGSEIKLSNSELVAYYSQYFYDQHSLVQLSENHTAELDNMLAELDEALAAAKTWEVAANQYFANHSTAASYGDAYNANRFYNLYTESLTTYNEQINNYNVRVNEYNSLIEALNGKPLEQVPKDVS